MLVELKEEEQDTVRYALEFLERELKNERVKTDRKDWKVSMHDEENLIEEILRKVA